MYKSIEQIIKEEEEKKRQGKKVQVLTEDSTYTDLGFANLNENFYQEK